MSASGAAGAYRAVKFGSWARPADVATVEERQYAAPYVRGDLSGVRLARRRVQ